jgi:hypothetical protein
MEILDRILYNLGIKKIWDTKAYDVPVIMIKKGSGAYDKVTIDIDKLCFHSQNYQSAMNYAQTIYLDDYTVDELIATINSMGYIAAASYGDNTYLGQRKAYTLMDIKNQSIAPSVTLTAFTSSLWAILYPIARMLHNWVKNTDNAIPQLFLALTTGRWLDYFASFFNVQRESNDNDISVRRKVFANLANIKTNNIALAELVTFLIKTKVEVEDVGASLFKITVSPDYMGKSDIIRNAILPAKGGGIGYFLNYLAQYSEDYPAYFFDIYDTEFKDSDTMGGIAIRSLSEDIPYGYVQEDMSFIIDRDIVGTNGALILEVPDPYMLKDEVTMTFTRDGVIVRSEKLE